jgi:hypothetical protein
VQLALLRRTAGVHPARVAEAASLIGPARTAKAVEQARYRLRILAGGGAGEGGG